MICSVINIDILFYLFYFILFYFICFIFIFVSLPSLGDTKFSLKKVIESWLVNVKKQRDGKNIKFFKNCYFSVSRNKTNKNLKIWNKELFKSTQNIKHNIRNFRFRLLIGYCHTCHTRRPFCSLHYILI